MLLAMVVVPAFADAAPTPRRHQEQALGIGERQGPRPVRRARKGHATGVELRTPWLGLDPTRDVRLGSETSPRLIPSHLASDGGLRSRQASNRACDVSSRQVQGSFRRWVTSLLVSQIWVWVTRRLRTSPRQLAWKLLPTLDMDQAVFGLTSRPSTKRSPATTRPIRLAPPLSVRQLVDSRSTILNTR